MTRCPRETHVRTQGRDEGAPDCDTSATSATSCHTCVNDELRRADEGHHEVYHHPRQSESPFCPFFVFIQVILPFPLQSVLSEVYAADKAASGFAPPSTVVGILRKATTRRVSRPSPAVLTYLVNATSHIVNVIPPLRASSKPSLPSPLPITLLFSP